MEFTKIELAVLDWIATHSTSPELQDQLCNAQPIERQFTGKGSYTMLKVLGVHGRLPKFTPPDYPNGPVHGPEIRSPEIEIGACSLLWLEDGYVDCLELAAYGDSFPEEVESFSLQKD